MRKSILMSVLLAALAPALVWAVEAIDINKADAATLAEAISGVGMARAEAIVAYRDRHGPFATVDDLVLVRGIGRATIDNNRERLTAGE